MRFIAAELLRDWRRDMILTNRSNERRVAHKTTDRKGHIRDSAASILIADGLTNWSIERCSKEARCAKGLVLHYFGSKEALLAAVGGALSAERWNSWSSALTGSGIGDLDTLWARLADPRERGRGRALLELRLSGVPSAALSAADGTDLRRRLARALELRPDELPAAGALEHLLEGYLLALLRGVPEDEVREAFFRYWLSYVR
jgi:AcrR family transcriptional regulator